MEQGRDLSKGGSPALLVGVAKFEAALKACDKIGAANCEGMGDCVDLAVEVLLWMVDACELVANAGHGEDNIASCKVRRGAGPVTGAPSPASPMRVSVSVSGFWARSDALLLQRAIELVESAHKLIELDPTHFRYQLCRDTLHRLQERASWQLSEQVGQSGVISDVFEFAGS